MTEFKTGTQSKKDREKHSGIVFSVVEKDDHSLNYIVLKESDGNHIYYPTKGKVAQYLQPIQPGENITFEALTEKDGNKTIVWVLGWERVHKAVHSTGDAKKVADTIVSSGQGKERTLDDIYREAEEKKKNPPPAGGAPRGHSLNKDLVVEDQIPHATTTSLPVESEAERLYRPDAPDFLTDGQKKDRRIGYYSNLNTACEIVKAALSTYPVTGKDKAEPMTIPDVYAAVIQVAKNLHDWVEERIKE